MGCNCGGNKTANGGAAKTIHYVVTYPDARVQRFLSEAQAQRAISAAGGGTMETVEI